MWKAPTWKPRVSNTLLAHHRKQHMQSIPAAIAADALDDLADARAELARMEAGLKERITERDMAEMEMRLMRPVILAAQVWQSAKIDRDYAASALSQAIDAYEKGEK